MLATLITATALVTKQPTSGIQPVLKLRGGLAGVDSTAVATYASYLFTANAGVMALAPEKAAEMYGVEKPTDLISQLIEWSGGSMIAIAIASLLALGGMDFTTAVAWGFVPQLIQNIQGLLKGTAEKLGFGTMAKIMPVAVSGLLTAGLFGKLSFLDTGLALKITAVWSLINGLGAYFATTPFFNAWEGPPMSAQETAIAKFFGGAILCTGIFTGSVAFLEAETLTAIAYTWAGFLATQIDSMFISGTMDIIGADKNPGYVWLAIQAFVVAAILA